MLFGCVGLKAQQRHLLENENALAEIDLRQGALVGLKNKETGWVIIGNGEKDVCFEASVRLADGSFHVIDASTQEQPKVMATENTVTLVWNSFDVAGKKLE